MRQWTLLIASSLILLSSCNSKKPNEAKLRSSIDQYLLTQTRTCVAVDGKFPHDVPAGDKSGEAAELAALEHAGWYSPQIPPRLCRVWQALYR